MPIPYRLHWRLRLFWAVALPIYAAINIYRFATATPGSLAGIWPAAEVVFWSTVPPLWFFLEYYAFDNGWIALPPNPKAGANADEQKKFKEDFLAGVKAYADFASKIWVAVASAVIFLYGIQKL